MDFTLEDWEQLGLDQGDLFWDTALDNYQNLFLLNPCKPKLTCPDGGEELEAVARESPESEGLAPYCSPGRTGDICTFPLSDVAEVKNCPLAQDFLEEGLSQEIMETLSKDGLWNSSLGKACVGETWLDSLLGDPESLQKSDVVANKESLTECRSPQLQRDLGPESLLSVGEDSVMLDLPEKSPAPAESQEHGTDFGCDLDQSQQNPVPGGKKLYKCSECEKSFSQSYHLIQHWIIHTREKPAVHEEYEEGFSQMSCPFVPLTTDTGYKTCPHDECGEACSENTQLWDPKIHPGEEPCKNQDSDPPSDLGVQPPEDQKPQTGDQSYKCNEGGQGFSQTSHLTQHQKTHTEKHYECAKCKATFNLIKYLLQHQETHATETTSESQECGKGIEQSLLLVEHQSIHTGEKPYECDQCGRLFRNISTLKVHQRVHSGEKPYKCNECGKAFYRSTHLNEHQRIHTGYRPYKCHQCIKSFSRPSHLIRHQSVHTTGMSYCCDRCKKTFTHHEYLVQHQKMHAMETLHECQECGERFFCSSTLACHQSVHTREKQGLDESGSILDQDSGRREHSGIDKKHFKCNKCEKTFSCSKYLTQHERVHTRVKPFECDQCGKAFSKSTQLLRHQNIHSRARPYECGDCGKTFIRSTSFTKHQSTHKSEHTFTCSDCGQTFSQSAHLSEHQLTHTEEKKLFKCSKCDKAFPQSNCLTQHQRTPAGKKSFECDECRKSFHPNSCLSEQQRDHTVFS
ncbi:zinc finger protein 473 isoform X2 [Hyaena hyaena]|uniref:zinc finger protein 473 isoform X2 n=1 Tax=Hyaena hyaena TaxID=95912 RepID=UPI001921D9D9|nr:zinc finger protein 473 isoform X2 [Hyaena hyaena]